ADHTVRLWEVASGQVRAQFEGHTGQVSALAFSPDDNTLATGSGDTTVLIWDLRGHHPLAPAAGEKGSDRHHPLAPAAGERGRGEGDRDNSGERGKGDRHHPLAPAAGE